MFVVRITVDDEKSDYKAFEGLQAANDRFKAAWLKTHDGEFRSVALYEVGNTSDVRAAIDAVKSKASSIRLLDLKEPESIEFAKFASKINLDLDI